LDAGISCQTACKPGSVLARRRAMDDHSSGTPVARRLARPTRAAAREPACRASGKPTCRPYLVLLRVGFAVPPLLPGARCALTAPFHPCRRLPAGGLLSVALSLGSPPPGVTRHPCFRGARTFLDPRVKPADRGHPAVWQTLGSSRTSGGQPDQWTSSPGSRSLRSISLAACMTRIQARKPSVSPALFISSARRAARVGASWPC
jgi:hypothetical protein